NTSYQLADKINQTYFMKNYLLCVVLGVFSMLLFYWDEGDFSSLTYIIVSFILFPFAKLIFDVIIGFKMKAIIESQTFIFYYAYQLIYIVYLLLFLFSLPIAPFGILFLIVRALYRWNKKRKENR